VDSGGIRPFRPILRKADGGTDEFLIGIIR